MNPNAFLKAYSHFEISTTAYAEIPSSRPVNPNFSVVVALIDTSSTSMPITSAKTCCICGPASRLQIAAVLHQRDILHAVNVLYRLGDVQVIRFQIKLHRQFSGAALDHFGLLLAE